MAKNMNMVGALFGGGPWARAPLNQALYTVPTVIQQLGEF